MSRFANPCLDVTAPKVRDERTQHLSPDQFRRVLAASSDRMLRRYRYLPALGLKYISGSRRFLARSRRPGWLVGSRFAAKLDHQPVDVLLLLFGEVTNVHWSSCWQSNPRRSQLSDFHIAHRP